jgi:hypothetical protein
MSPVNHVEKALSPGEHAAELLKEAIEAVRAGDLAAAKTGARAAVRAINRAIPRQQWQPRAKAGAPAS